MEKDFGETVGERRHLKIEKLKIEKTIRWFF